MDDDGGVSSDAGLLMLVRSREVGRLAGSLGVAALSVAGGLLAGVVIEAGSSLAGRFLVSEGTLALATVWHAGVVSADVKPFTFGGYEPDDVVWGP